MHKDKEIAYKLRRQGKSYRQIRNELKIPLSTLSDWFSELDWSGSIARRLAAEIQTEHSVRLAELNKVRGSHLKRVYEEARVEAREELNMYRYNPLFIAGLMLYWGEGGKNPRDGVKFSNTDPTMIRLYIIFLRDVCRIPASKIKLHVLYYPDLVEKICRGYWAKVSGLPQDNFTKSTLIAGRHRTRRLTWGVCNVTVSSLYFKQKMLEWLRLLPGELMQREYYANMGTEADMV